MTEPNPEQSLRNSLYTRLIQATSSLERVAHTSKPSQENIQVFGGSYIEEETLVDAVRYSDIEGDTVEIAWASPIGDIKPNGIVRIRTSSDGSLLSVEEASFPTDSPQSDVFRVHPIFVGETLLQSEKQTQNPLDSSLLEKIASILENPENKSPRKTNPLKATLRLMSIFNSSMETDLVREEAYNNLALRYGVPRTILRELSPDGIEAITRE